MLRAPESPRHWQYVCACFATSANARDVTLSVIGKRLLHNLRFGNFRIDCAGGPWDGQCVPTINQPIF